jgi:predicted transcriptional regulator
LPDDYPLIRPAYSEARSKMAKTLGLGRKGTAARSTKRRARQTPAKQN